MTVFSSECLKLACELSIDQTAARYNMAYQEPAEQRKLNATDKNMLAGKILVLPEEYINILFFKYVFNFDAATTESILNLENCFGKLNYAKELLTLGMGLPHDTGIHDESMAKACGRALSKYMQASNAKLFMVKPVYSARFRRKLKSIKSAQKQRSLITVITRSAAIFILVALLNFAGTLAVNAELRERIFRWVVNTFPQFSEFRAAGVTLPLESGSGVDLLAYGPAYIPEGFYVCDAFIFSSRIGTEYRNDESQTICFRGALPDGSPIAFDTGDALIEDILINGGEGFYWETDGLTYVIWEQDGFMFSLVSELSKEEVIQIAHSVEN